MSGITVLTLTREQLDECIELAVGRALDAQTARPELLDDSACALLLGISPKTLRSRLVPAGLPFVRVGDMRRYERAAVLAFVRGGPKP